jgi:hypothetical protein
MTEYCENSGTMRLITVTSIILCFVLFFVVVGVYIGNEILYGILTMQIVNESQ